MKSKQEKIIEFKKQRSLKAISFQGEIEKGPKL